MRLLLDTPILVWATSNTARLSTKARGLLETYENELVFSAVSIWEVTIRHALGRPDFSISPTALRDSLLVRGVGELPLKADHGLAVAGLPPIHRDPFDRILIAQAQFEAMTLVTADRIVATYPGPILKV